MPARESANGCAVSATRETAGLVCRQRLVGGQRYTAGRSAVRCELDRRHSRAAEVATVWLVHSRRRIGWSAGEHKLTGEAVYGGESDGNVSAR